MVIAVKVAIREMPTERELRALGDAAAKRGDHDFVVLCWRAWDGDRDALVAVAEKIAAQAATTATE